MFKVVMFWSQLTVEGGVLLAGFVTKSNLLASGVEQDAAWYSLVPGIVELQYDGIDFAWFRCQVWPEEIGNRTVRCSKIDGS